jgi:pyruvyltransferase
MEVLKSALRRLRPTIGPRVEEEMGIERLFWWRARKPHYLFGKLVYWTRSYNVGDILSPIIIQRILQNRGLFLKDMEAGRRLLAVGSILHFAREGDTIWGSGINGKIGTHEYCFTSLDVRAVRGPLTRRFLLDRGIACPAVYGDPALLIPYLFPEFRVQQRQKQRYVVIPHLHEISMFAGEAEVLYPTCNWRRFISRILTADLVISSSLHGIIVAEAFGIPSRLLRLTSAEPMLKYQDYYSGTGRNKFSYAHSIEDAQRMGGEELPQFDADGLLRAFPIDLWR